MPADRVPVLMYHRVGRPDSSNDVYCIDPARFSSHMAALRTAGYQAISIDAFARWQTGTGSLPDKSFLLTFDDGFLGIFDHAAPILSSHDWPATVFLVAGKLGQTSDWEVTTAYKMKPHQLMGAEELAHIANLGFSLQSHSLLHRDLTTLDPDSLFEDLSRSRDAIARLTNESPLYVAYPYGRHDAKVRNAAKRAGFCLGFSVESGFNRPHRDTFNIRRLDILGTETPAKLLRKIRLGTNDGSLGNLLRYYGGRLLRR